jgi:hypothetical protein
MPGPCCRVPACQHPRCRASSTFFLPLGVVMGLRAGKGLALASGWRKETRAVGRDHAHFVGYCMHGAAAFLGAANSASSSLQQLAERESFRAGEVVFPQCCRLRATVAPCLTWQRVHGPVRLRGCRPPRLVFRTACGLLVAFWSTVGCKPRVAEGHSCWRAGSAVGRHTPHRQLAPQVGHLHGAAARVKTQNSSQPTYHLSSLRRIQCHCWHLQHCGPVQCSQIGLSKGRCCTVKHKSIPTFDVHNNEHSSSPRDDIPSRWHHGDSAHPCNGCWSTLPYQTMCQPIMLFSLVRSIAPKCTSLLSTRTVENSESAFMRQVCYSTMLRYYSYIIQIAVRLLH